MTANEYVAMLVRQEKASLRSRRKRSTAYWMACGCLAGAIVGLVLVWRAVW